MRKQIPILMSTPMVQAEKEGRKTMTRRTTGLDEINESPDIWTLNSMWDSDDGIKAVFDRREDLTVKEVTSFTCPYGKPGDILWVKEEHYRYGHWVPDGKTKTGRKKWKFVADKNTSLEIIGEDPYMVYYSDEPPYVYRKSRDKSNPGKNQWYKRLARFMPKKYARIWLEVTSIRVERVKSISFADAEDEGVKCLIVGQEIRYMNYMWRDDPAYIEYKSPTFANPIDSFRTLWQSINGADSWKANPWVWVVSFKILSTTGKPEGLEGEVAR